MVSKFTKMAINSNVMKVSKNYNQRYNKTRSSELRSCDAHGHTLHLRWCGKSLDMLYLLCFIYYDLCAMHTRMNLLTSSLLELLIAAKNRTFVFFSIVRHASTQLRMPAPRGMASQHLWTFERGVSQN